MNQDVKIPYREILAEQSALWADKYALTMAQAFFTNGKHNINTTFHAFIRSNPFQGGYLITGGQNIIREWLNRHWYFDETDINLLKNTRVPDPKTGKEQPLFTADFLDMLAGARMALTIDAMPEGEIAFPHEPIYRVHGPLWQCLMVEAGLLNIMNSQSLFATLASRLVEAAEGGQVLEFGLRRAQAAGGLEASRGAYLGGVHGTSNMLAEKYYQIPTAGTFAHAFVMVYEDEVTAFAEYAGAMPYSGVFLVDTYDSLQGVERAVELCRKSGTVLAGIRLDSGDLTYLSGQARQILDQAGFKEAKIIASNELDEETIAAIRNEGGQIDVWGVGTHLATARAQPALGGVYKIGAVYDEALSVEEIEAVRKLVQEGRQDVPGNGFKRDVLKLSEQIGKITIPGELDILRFLKEEEGHLRLAGDVITSTFQKDPVKDGKLVREVKSVRKDDPTLIKTFAPGAQLYRPLRRLMEKGKAVGPEETIHEARARAGKAMAMLAPSYRRLKNPHIYISGIEQSLYDKRTQMIKSLRSHNS